MEIPEQMLKDMTLIVVGKEENLHLPEKAPKLSVWTNTSKICSKQKRLTMQLIFTLIVKILEVSHIFHKKIKYQNCSVTFFAKNFKNVDIANAE
jgi:hypothetical protein